MSAPISTDDIEGVRLLLAAGADPNRPLPDDADEPPLYAAIRADCSGELIRLLLDAGADPGTPGPDGTPHRMAARRGRADVARLVRGYGAPATATDVDLVLSACLHADRAGAERLRPGQLADDDHATLVRAAASGDTAAVELMVDLGFPIGARGDDGGTALHAAAYNGSVAVGRLLLDRGADLVARDTTWDDTPLGWAIVGSGFRPNRNPRADWVATVQWLLDAGAPIDGIVLSADDPKPPSPEVAELLRTHGVPDDDGED